MAQANSFDVPNGRGVDRPAPGPALQILGTRVITQGVEPSLHVDYKHSRIKQYHNKEGRALRTETIINDSYDCESADG